MDNSPKYIHLANWLRAGIREGRQRPGDKLHSENTLCRMFSLSRQTVRQAIGILEQEGLVVRRRGSGTYVSRPGERPDTAASRIVAVVITYPDSYIFPAIIQGIERVLSAQGYSMLLTVTHNQPAGEALALRRLMENRVAGLLAEPAKSGLPSLCLPDYRRLSEDGLPIIFMNAKHPELDLPCVRLDDRAAGRMATEHLLQKGHQRIAGLFKSDDSQGHLRYLGYMEALRDRGVDADPQDIHWFTTEDLPHMGLMTDRLLRSLSGCTGLVCYNDNVAYPLCQHLRGQGLYVPGDLSVVSVDNAEPGSGSHTPLTTIAHPMQRLGEAAASALLERVQNPEAPADRLFEPQLIVRTSVRELAPV